MKKSKFIAYSAILLASMLVIGCNTAERDSEKIGKIIQNPQDNNISDDILDQITPGIQIIQDDNNTTIDPSIDDSLANSASTAYKTDMTTSKEAMSIEKTAIINFNIKDIFSNTLATSDDIESVTLTTNGNYLNFINKEGEYGTTVIINSSQGAVAIRSLKKSGATFIKLEADIVFYDTNGDKNIKKLTSYLPITIITNNNSTMTIIPNYADESKKKYDASLGLYIDTFTIHVVDKYGNKVKDGTKVHVGIVNNLKKDPNNNDHPLYSSVLNGANINTNLGTLTNTSDDKTEFLATGVNLSNVKTGDTVVVLANENENNPLHLGGWSVDSETNNRLNISSNYTVTPGTNTNGLSFAIGNDKKVNTCEETLASAAVYATPEYEDYLVKDGIVIVELRYDPYMVGKTTFIYANSTVDDKRVGISRRVDMQGTGPQDFPFVCDNSDGNVSKSCTKGLILKLKDSNHLIQNARFNSYTQLEGTICDSVNIFPDAKIDCEGVKTVSISAPAGKICSIQMNSFKPEFE